MPDAPMRNCKKPGCHRGVVDRGKWYCEEHQALERPKREKPKPDAAAPAPEPEYRPGPRQRGYTRYWEKLRSYYLARHPLCERCLAVDRIEAACVVHHKDENPANNSDDNLRAVSRRCHEQIHGRQAMTRDEFRLFKGGRGRKFRSL